MTADAKVGLLLGLVFIAIIAFVFNGLPDFVHSAGEKRVPETAVTTQTGGGNLVIEPTVVDVARGLQEKRKTNVRYVDPPVDTTVLENYAGSAKATIADSTAPEAAKTPESKSPEAAPRIEKTVLTTELIQPQKQPDAVVASKQQTTVPSGVSHVVQDGESLGEIAKKYYGEQEGNKLSTIQMLCDANKNILDPDTIRAGDQLVIPKMKSAVDAEQAVQVKKESAPASLMDKFKDVFTSVEKKPETTVKSTQMADKKAVQATIKSKTPIAEKTTLLKTDKAQPVKANSQVPAVNKTSLLKTDKTQPVKTDSGASVANKMALLKTDKLDKSQPVKIENSMPVKGVTEYTIQSGDYLFKIAQKQLGDGNRYSEILKLNSGLSESERLKVGTKIRIPKK